MTRQERDGRASFDPAAGGWELVDDKGFLGLVGPTWRRLRDDRLEFAFRAEPKHANLRNVVQGGMLMTFADRALGRNSWRAAGEKPVATVEFNMQFVTAGKIGEVFEIRPEVVRKTSSLVFLRGDIVCGTRTVATATGIWKIL
jgi:acyl-coenzyme A thioesterase PaaI-like protein